MYISIFVCSYLWEGAWVFFQLHTELQFPRMIGVEFTKITSIGSLQFRNLFEEIGTSFGRFSSSYGGWVGLGLFTQSFSHPQY